MREKPDMKPTNRAMTFSQKIGAQEMRKLKARRRAVQGVWFGFRMFGIVGWSVAVPTLLGAALGRWLDERHPSEHSWTLTLLIVGLCLGCLNAWHWVAKENKAIHDESENKDE
ncbi:MAG TPA: AtpZ/AtpI family protein [Verrucomicrobiae bacterium]|jgi:ATP synthase protein I|nr:AtpZ/AtpI family protein [Verrucomicrobiae bacterium]